MTENPPEPLDEIPDNIDFSNGVRPIEVDCPSCGALPGEKCHESHVVEFSASVHLERFQEVLAVLRKRRSSP